MKKNKKEKKVNSLAVDFQPDAVEIAMRPLPFFARIGVWIGLFVFIAAITAAYFCHVDIIVNGTGKLVSLEPNIVMKPLERSVIKTINVKVGDVVHKGQTLITFDPVMSRAEEEHLENERDSLQAQYDRLCAEFQGTNYTPIDDSEDTRWQKAIFQQRQSYFDEKMIYYEGAIKRIDANIASTKDMVAKQKERFKGLTELYNSYEELSRKSGGSTREVIEIRMQYQQLDADIAKLENSIMEISHERESTVAARQSFVMEWKKDVSEQMVQAERQLIATKKSLEKAVMLNSYVTLEAPCDAIVHEIAAFSVGSAVREAEPLITLVPINCGIEMEAEIPAKDIGRVKVGDSVRVKLNAFPFQKHGTLDGIVLNISEDTFQRQTKTNEMDTPTYYRARVQISGTLRNIHKNFRLIPGMEAQAEIKTGTRRVLEYIIYPLIKSLDEAIHEP